MIGPQRAGLPAIWFDGRSARAVAAVLSIEGGQLVVRQADGLAEGFSGAVIFSLNCANVNWPERTRGSERLINFASGASIQSSTGPAWDEWVKAHVPRRVGWVERMQSSWPMSLMALAVLVAFGLGAYVWGLPAAARMALAVIPSGVDAALGETTLARLDRSFAKPSQLKPSEQAHWQGAFAAMVAKGYPQGSAPRHKLLFRSTSLGPNALALPGGTIIITDELIQMAQTEPEFAQGMVLGALAHELGHVQLRHGMQHVVSASALGLVSGFLLGDFSGVAATGAVVLAQASYSRDAEREADDVSRRLMAASDISPLGMVRFFSLVRSTAVAREQKACDDAASERLVRLQKLSGDLIEPQSSEVEAQAKECRDTVKPDANRRRQSLLGLSISSHPADAERVRAFENAQRQK